MMNEEIENSSELIIALNKETSSITKKRIGAKMKLAARIDDIRKERNWNRNDLARLFKKQPSVITKWLSGTHNFTIDTIVEIEEILKIKLLPLEEKPETQIKQYQVHVFGPCIPNEPWGFISSSSTVVMKTSATKVFKSDKLKEV